MSERYSYDRTAMGPASRLKDAEQYLKQGDRQIEQAKGVLHGLVKELELFAHGAHNPKAQQNLHNVKALAEHVDKLDKEIETIVHEMDRALKSLQ